MGCGCKKTKKDEKTGELIEFTEGKNNRLFNISLFIISVIILPLLYPVIIGILFKHFVIGGDIDFTKIVQKIKNFKKEEPEDEEIDVDSLDENDYELIGVDEIPSKTELKHE